MKNQNTIPEVPHNTLSPRKDTDIKLMELKYSLDIAALVFLGVTCLSAILMLWLQTPDEALCGVDAAIRSNDGLHWGFRTIGLAAFTACCKVLANRIDVYCGFYRCPGCGHIHIPTNENFSGSFGLFYKRKLRCPACGKRSWNEKVLVSAAQPNEN